MKRTVLVTGANGFIGTHIVRQLLEDGQSDILALVKGRDLTACRHKLARSWWDWPDLVNEIGARIEVLCGDVRLPKLDLDDRTYEKTVEKVTHIIHTAADWRLVPLDQLRSTNVQGTANVIEFAKEAKRHHHLERLSHISTAYVAGARKGSVHEEDLTDEYGFNTDYERSKYEGEQLARAAKTEIPASVFRPSMVVGHSRTGAVKTFNTFYFPLRLYLSGRMRFVPVSRSLRINVVPVDYVARAVVSLTFDNRAEGLDFHIVAPHDSLPTVEETLNLVRRYAREKLNVRLPKPIYLGLPAGSTATLLRIRRAFRRKNRRESDALISLSPYFSENRQFRRSNVDALLGPYDLKWRKVMPGLLDYAICNSFFHRSDRTVHEQALFRLGGRRYPITYYDLIEGRVAEKGPEEMRRDIIATTAALGRHGIVPGDRVALVGLNSTRYLAVEIAIGLAGAASVPLYYTAPPADIDQILQASGAKLLFIGAPALLPRVKELAADVTMISICREAVPRDLLGKVVTWDDFISKEEAETTPVRPDVGFGDIATIMYSSGTTGRPKGSVFNHNNLRYMAESTVSLIPWQTRNRKCTYLSFLPESHVVEGILATFSPYYIPAPVDIYFLEDFRNLAKVLPKVKPTIFFSVPRIYERIWEGLEKSTLGRFYLGRKEGLPKRVLGAILRRIILRRAGLDKCAQLITGSARFDAERLLKYRELGIEIHNAYGLTEAPLVTINLVGRNRIGTVGEPLPKTEVKISEEGEIMVRGPQVTAGYFDEALEPPIKEGWLMTGDLGRITDDGSLELLGRKKELIKTSYGKCIYSGKIEDLIRGIPNVAEAMLVGESRPYCSALIWINKESWNEQTIKAVDGAILRMNQGLSNPEKIKKWALLMNLLSVENGDLTPNFKLKRNLATERHARVIDALYGGAAPDGELHIGAGEKSE